MSKLIPLVIIFTLVTGCASKYGKQQTNVNYYPTCYQPIHKLRASENQVAKSTGVGLVFGAITAGALAFLLTGKVENALVAGIAGASTGAVVGHMHGQAEKQADENKLMTSYLENLEGDIQGLDIVSASAKTSLQCYDKEFDILLANIKNRVIMREEAWARYNEIVSGRDEAIKLLGEAITHGRDLDEQYEQAFKREEKVVEQTPVSKKAYRSRVTRQKEKLVPVRRRKSELTSKLAQLSNQQQEAKTKQLTSQRDFAARLEEIDL